jgi:hypothetical protein
MIQSLPYSGVYSNYKSIKLEVAKEAVCAPKEDNNKQ